MGAFGKDVSKFILLGASTLMFLIAAAGLGLSPYVYYNAAAKAVITTSLLMAVLILSVVLMSFSILGCKTALASDSKMKSSIYGRGTSSVQFSELSTCTYLFLVLVLLIAEFFAAGVISNAGHALQLAKTHHFDVQSGLGKAAENTIVFLHDQLGELYDGSKCQGGQPWLASEAKPFNFSQVECHNKAASQALNSLFQNASLSEEKEYATYKNCVADPAFKRSSKKFTQAFCGSEVRIVLLAGRYGRYLVWAPVCVAVLTFIVFVATICRLGDLQRLCGREQKTRQPETFRCPYLRENAKAFIQTEPLQSYDIGTPPQSYDIGTPPQSPRLQILAKDQPFGEP